MLRHRRAICSRRFLILRPVALADGCSEWARASITGVIGTDGALTWVCAMMLIADAPTCDKHDLLDAMIALEVGKFIFEDYGCGHIELQGLRPRERRGVVRARPDPRSGGSQLPPRPRRRPGLLRRPHLSSARCAHLEKPDDGVSVNDYFNDGTLWALPWESVTTSWPVRSSRQGRPVWSTRATYSTWAAGTLRFYALRAGNPGGSCCGRRRPTSTSPATCSTTASTAWPPENPTAYAATLERTRDLPVSQVCPGHYGAFGHASMLALIHEQVADLGNRRWEQGE